MTSINPEWDYKYCLYKPFNFKGVWIMNPISNRFEVKINQEDSYNLNINGNFSSYQEAIDWLISREMHND